jgi:hypothetical protein
VRRGGSVDESEFHESISTIYRFKGQVKKLGPVRSKTRWLFPGVSMRLLARALGFDFLLNIG